MLFRTENPETAAFLSLIAKPTTDHYIPGHCLMLRAADFNTEPTGSLTFPAPVVVVVVVLVVSVVAAGVVAAGPSGGRRWH